MALYKPQTPLQHLFTAFETAPGYLGRTCPRKMKRRYVKRALADFDLALAQLRPGDMILDFGGFFVERHKHLDPAALPRIRDLRMLVSQVPNRYINLYWV